MIYSDIENLVDRQKLKIYGAFYPNNNDGLHPLGKTLILLGPHEPHFWTHFPASKEWINKEPDPMDRWSYRIISEIALKTDTIPYFPFGQKRYPFYHWAIRSGSTWVSPVSLLVHQDVGLMVSYRGALGLQTKINLPPVKENPCLKCDRPCITACPAGALTAKGYNVASCKQFLTTHDSNYDLSQGCLVRRSCPLSQNLERDLQQSEYLMAVFKEAPII